MAFEWLFPRRCLGCSREGGYLCSACQQQLESVKFHICPYCRKPAVGGHAHPACQSKTGLNGLTSVFKYNRLTRKLIHKLKYRFIPEIAPILTQNMVNTLARQPVFNYFLSQLKQKQPILVPVPLFWWRFNWRGFNQSELLADNLLVHWQGLVKKNWLKRKRLTWSQAKLAKQDRFKNVSRAFSLTASAEVKAKDFLLVDDVWTTGSTMSACARILKQAGANWVWGLTLAR